MWPRAPGLTDTVESYREYLELSARCRRHGARDPRKEHFADRRPPDATLPTGTVTFLFTDIEGSTRLWQAFPAVMKEALARHHVLLQHAIDAYNGYVFQIVGDGICAAFRTAADGIAAALAAQHALARESWGETGPLRVRMALHTGSTDIQSFVRPALRTR